MMRNLKLALAFILTLSFLFFSQTDVFAAGFGSSTSLNIQQGSSEALTISIDTSGKEVNGADLVLSFNPQLLEVTSVSFTPGVLEHNFHNVNTAEGKITLTSTETTVTGFFKGSSSYATITLKGKAVGSGNLTYVCQDGGTNDTNLLERGTGEDLINCGSLSTVAYSITTQPQNTPTPTDQNSNTSTPAPTNNGRGDTCGTPEAASNFTASGQNKTSILLSWQKSTTAQNYSIQYGTSVGSYQYGASSIGDTDKFLVNYLKPGTTYYFSLVGTNACKSSSAITASGTTKGSQAASVPRATQEPLPKAIENIPSFDNQVTLSQSVTEQKTQVVTDENLFPTETPIVDTLPDTTSNGRGISPVLRTVFIALFLLGIAAALFFFFKKKGGGGDSMTTPLPDDSATTSASQEPPSLPGST